MACYQSQLCEEDIGVTPKFKAVGHGYHLFSWVFMDHYIGGVTGEGMLVHENNRVCYQ